MVWWPQVGPWSCSSSPGLGAQRGPHAELEWEVVGEDPLSQGKP